MELDVVRVVLIWLLGLDSRTGFSCLSYDAQVITCCMQISIDVMKLDMVCVVPSWIRKARFSYIYIIS